MSSENPLAQRAIEGGELNATTTQKRRGSALTIPIETPVEQTRHAQAVESAGTVTNTMARTRSVFTASPSHSWSIFPQGEGAAKKAEKRRERVTEKNADADERAEGRERAIKKGGLGGWVAERQNQVDNLIRGGVVLRHVIPTFASELARRVASGLVKTALGLAAGILTWSFTYHTMSGLWVSFLGSAMNPALALALSIPVAWWVWEHLRIGEKISKKVSNVFGIGTPTKKKDEELKDAGLDNPNRII